MKKKVFKYRFVYFSVIIYLILILLIYFKISIDKVYFFDGRMSMRNFIDFVFNNSILISFIFSTFFLIKKNRRFFLAFNIGVILFSVILLMGIKNYSDVNADKFYTYSSFFVFSINLILVFLVNKFKNPSISYKEIDEIGKPNP